MRVRDSSPRTMTCGYFYICFIVNLSLVAGQSVHYVLKGREAILPTTIKHPDDILWKHNGDKVIAFDSKEEQVFRQYQGRAALAWDTAELTIADVRYEDSGEYELEALVGDRTHRSQFMLKVLDEVAKPTISCEINDESSNKTSGSRATLLCSSDSQTPESLTFHWNGDGKVHTGQRLTIALGNEPNELQYSCTATNPLQAETTIFITKDCNTERLLNEHQTAISPTLIIIIVVLGLALIILCILLFRFRKKLKKVCFKKGENNDLEKQNTEESKNPLLHRQETFASKQKLPQQLQDDNGNVTDTPQKKEIKKDLENLHRTGTVQKTKGIFDQGGLTKVLPNPQTELQPQPSPQSRPPHVDQESESGSSEAESKDQSDSEEKSHTEPMFDKELHTQPSDHEKAEVSALAVDSETSANEKPDIEKAEKSLLAVSYQTKEPTGLESSRASGTPDQDLDSGTGDVWSKGQRDVDGKLHTDPVVYDEPQRDPSKSDLTRDSGTSTNEKMTPPQSPPDSDLPGVPNNTHNNEETENPLLYSQETFLSKRKRPQHLQGENGNVKDTPQKEETKKDLENLHRTGTVQKLKGVFDQGGPTKVLPDPQTEAENNTDNDEKTTSHHALSSTIPSPGADGPESKTLTDSDREAATDMSQHDNAEKTGAAGGSRSIQLKEESSKAFKQSELQPQPSPQSRPPHVDQESESGSSEAESKDQSDSEEKSHTEPMFDKELHTQPSDHEKAEVSALAVDSETSANEKPDIEKAEKSLLADSSQTKEPTGLESSRASGTPDQDLDSGTGELRSKGQRDVDGKLHTDPVVYDEPQRDSSESDLTRDSGTSTNEKMTLPQSPPDSDLRGVPNNTHNNEETESQPEAQDLVHVDSSSEEPSDVQTSTASVQPGSEKKTDEQESVPPTPPPPSTLSPSVDIRETKDTDGEHKADANSDQVSVETKDKTDKDSDSSGSKHINEPDKSSEGGKKKPAVRS